MATRPYGHPSEGTAESVAKLTPQDVRDFYHAHYKIGSAMIAVVGDVKADEVKAKLEKAFDALKGTVPAASGAAGAQRARREFIRRWSTAASCRRLSSWARAESRAPTRTTIGCR